MQEDSEKKSFNSLKYKLQLPNFCLLINIQFHLDFKQCLFHLFMTRNPMQKAKKEFKSTFNDIHVLEKAVLKSSPFGQILCDTIMGISFDETQNNQILYSFRFQARLELFLSIVKFGLFKRIITGRNQKILFF